MNFKNLENCDILKNAYFFFYFSQNVKCFVFFEVS